MAPRNMPKFLSVFIAFCLLTIVVLLQTSAPVDPVRAQSASQADSDAAPAFTLVATSDSPTPLGGVTKFFAGVNVDPTTLTFIWDFGLNVVH